MLLQSLFYQNTKTKSLFNVQLNIAEFVRHFRPPAALQCTPEPPAAEEQYQFSSFSKQYALLIYTRRKSKRSL